MYVSRTGRVVIIGVPSMDNGADTFHNGLVRVIRNKKYGFANRKGQIVIAAHYDGAMNFEQGKSKVCLAARGRIAPSGVVKFIAETAAISTRVEFE